MILELAFPKSPGTCPGNRFNWNYTAYGQDRFSISKANFLPDEPKSWAEVIRLPRPDWLDIYRQFPHLDSNEPAEPARGTLIISDDEEWLRKHISRLTAVVYILGLEESQWRTPADAIFNRPQQAPLTNSVVVVDELTESE